MMDGQSAVSYKPDSPELVEGRFSVLHHVLRQRPIESQDYRVKL